MKALLIGSPVGELQGTQTDLSLFAEIMDTQEIPHKRLYGPEATRQGILKGLQDFADDLEEQQACLIYYTGHGCLLKHRSQPSYLPSMVPYDMEASTADRFNGILEWEISAYLAELSQKTKDITFIWDACHASGMTRRSHHRSKFLPTQIAKASLGNHLSALNQGDLSRLRVGSIEGVRLFASMEQTLAVEYQSHRNGPVSLFTEVLVSLLQNEAWHRRSWRHIIAQLSSRIRHIAPEQFPCAFGQLDRMPFEAQQAMSARQFPFFLNGYRTRKPMIRAKKLEGIAAGDQVHLFDPTKESEQLLAEAEVTAFTEIGAELRIHKQYDSLHNGLCARLVRSPSNALPVSTFWVTDAVEQTLSESPMLQLVAQKSDEAEVMVVREGEAYGIFDPLGSRLAPLSHRPNQLRHYLEVLARHRNIHLLKSLSGQSSLDIDLIWGVYRDGDLELKALLGSSLEVNQPVAMHLHNRSQQTIWAQAYAVNLDYEICALLPHFPMGMPVRPDESSLLGVQETIQRPMWYLTWTQSQQNSNQLPQAESIIVIFANQPVSLRYLEGPGFSQIPKPTSNDRSSHSPPPFRYEVRDIQYILIPPEGHS